MSIFFAEQAFSTSAKWNSANREIVCLKQLILLTQVRGSLRTEIQKKLKNFGFKRSAEHEDLLQRVEDVEDELLLLHARVLAKTFDVVPGRFTNTLNSPEVEFTTLTTPEYLSAENLARNDFLECEKIPFRQHSPQKKLKSSASVSGSASSQLTTFHSAVETIASCKDASASLRSNRAVLAAVNDDDNSLVGALRETQTVSSSEDSRETIIGIKVGRILVTETNRLSLAKCLTQTMLDAVLLLRFRQSHIRTIKLVSSFVMSKIFRRHPVGSTVPATIQNISGEITSRL